MSFATGLHRLAQVIRWIGAILAGLSVIVAIGWLFSEKAGMAGWPDRGGIAAVFLVVGAVIYGIAWGIAWVLEGFAKE